jgi:hypothetical protein
MLSLLKRYSWKQFSIVTSTVAGYREFIQAVSEAAYKFESHNSYKYKNSIQFLSLWLLDQSIFWQIYFFNLINVFNDVVGQIQNIGHRPGEQ